MFWVQYMAPGRRDKNTINNYSSRKRRIWADIYNQEAVGRVGYSQFISGNPEKNNCFSKFYTSVIAVGFFRHFAFPTFFDTLIHVITGTFQFDPNKAIVRRGAKNHWSVVLAVSGIKRVVWRKRAREKLFINIPRKYLLKLYFSWKILRNGYLLTERFKLIVEPNTAQKLWYIELWIFRHFELFLVTKWRKIQTLIHDNFWLD